jgi:hypothetical protein
MGKMGASHTRSGATLRKAKDRYVERRIAVAFSYAADFLRNIAIIPGNKPAEMAQMPEEVAEMAERLRNRSDFVNFVDAMLLDEAASTIEELATALVRAAGKRGDLSRRHLTPIPTDHAEHRAFYEKRM